MKKQHYTYILVFTSTGPAFITEFCGNRTAKWEKNKKPLDCEEKFCMKSIQEIVLGLNLNGYYAVLIKSQWELNEQPYNYEEYEIKFIQKGNLRK